MFKRCKHKTSSLRAATLSRQELGEMSQGYAGGGWFSEGECPAGVCKKVK